MGYIQNFVENTSFYTGGIILFCCIYQPHLKGRSVNILSDIKPVRGAIKVGNHCPRPVVLILLGVRVLLKSYK